ncbi:TetR/AcrR family transcriptional regulator [Amycolatopsis magusensis]|uniref:AcrR family transcriptional regulator n=1 Tax=Amycolatopsis magusensis TaxID=882444 RepID=A0ABS4Q2Y1_9PSEU|nr:TetR/AcrR family transcriptional regulator [Amycolatopsis magusensis]MBP2185953.1 AcrR family transcriptional regulator [Amycolatopsis magusensis]
METKSPGTRERIVLATSRLMQRQGYDGTGLKQISREAEATLGSVYHFFPGGKRELAVAAVQHGDREFADLLRKVFADHEDPAEAVTACAVELGAGLKESGWVDGCPVATTALGAADRETGIQEAAAAAFAHWQDLVCAKLRGAGIAEGDARALATTVVSALEGAELSAQVSKSEEPLLAAGRHLAQLIGLYRP